jgi:hypothetical protein
MTKKIKSSTDRKLEASDDGLASLKAERIQLAGSRKAYRVEADERRHNAEDNERPRRRCA